MKKILFFLLFLAFFLLPKHTFAADIYTTEKLITVDTGSQRLLAWEGGKIVNQTYVSTGMYYTPTIKGSFKIYKKLRLQDMKGRYPPYEPYFIKDVPYVMYFTGAYAIHGTYWHNKFGSRASHGCVNVPVPISEWLYSWANEGTRVEG